MRTNHKKSSRDFAPPYTSRPPRRRVWITAAAVALWFAAVCTPLYLLWNVADADAPPLVTDYRDIASDWPRYIEGMHR